MIETIIKEQKLDNQLKHIQSEFINRNDYSDKKQNIQLKRKNIQFQIFNQKLSNRLSIDEQHLNHLKMKEKFDLLYKRIQQISLKQEYSKSKIQRRIIQPSQQQHLKKVNLINCVEGTKLQYKKFRNIKSKSIAYEKVQKDEKSVRSKQFQICTINQDDIERQLNSRFKMIIRRTRYKSKLLPLKFTSLSNNIEDYLSVQKINLKDLQQVIPASIKNPNAQKNSNIFNSKSNKNISPTLRLSSKKKFSPPYQTYYYRDFIWKVGYSNEMVVQYPLQYDPKIKIYVGHGNNSSLVKGILRRRPWYTIIDKLEDANFVWTQIKISEFIKNQKKVQKEIIKSQISYREQNILNQEQYEIFLKYWKENSFQQSKIKQDMNLRNKIMKIKNVKISEMYNFRIHNHFKNNYIIGNKKALFHTMCNYYQSIGQNIFKYLPLTFHIKNGLQDQQYHKFLRYYYQQAKKSKSNDNDRSLNVWIVKPGQFTNRGNGIVVCLNLEQIKCILKEKVRHSDGTSKTFIVQKYIEKPFLYKRRKFDLRHYMMITCLNGVTKGYWYRQGYVRTTSSQYTLKFNNGNIHLTNDAVQKNLPQYGKYQKGNKISYDQLNNYIIKSRDQKSFWTTIYPKMKKIATDTLRACGSSISCYKKTNFQIFGLDFMIDDKLDVWLIQVNTNPCLELSSPLLYQIIPKMLENAFEICLDPLFPPPIGINLKSTIFKRNINEYNGFQLVYDERQLTQRVISPTQLDSIVDIKLENQQDDVFEDDGQDWNDD